MTHNGSYGFVYGDNNRLQEVQLNGATLASYIYNGHGERVRKVDHATTYYHYDQAARLIAELDARGRVQAEYVYLDGEPLALVRTGRSDADGESVQSVYYYHNDHLGTPQTLTDSTRTVVWAADYHPFGKTRVTTDTITNNLRFPGQYYDEESGLHYNYYRHYDPSTGRYMSSDPIGLQGGMNTYLYANANPLRFIDPTGELSSAVFIAGLVIVAGGTAYWYYDFNECVEECKQEEECGEKNQTLINLMCRRECFLDRLPIKGKKGPRTST